MCEPVSIALAATSFATAAYGAVQQNKAQKQNIKATETRIAQNRELTLRSFEQQTEGLNAAANEQRLRVSEDSIARLRENRRNLGTALASGGARGSTLNSSLLDEFARADNRIRGNAQTSNELFGQQDARERSALALNTESALLANTPFIPRAQSPIPGIIGAGINSANFLLQSPQRSTSSAAISGTAGT